MKPAKNPPENPAESPQRWRTALLTLAAALQNHLKEKRSEIQDESRQRISQRSGICLANGINTFPAPASSFERIESLVSDSGKGCLVFVRKSLLHGFQVLASEANRVVVEIDLTLPLPVTLAQLEKELAQKKTNRRSLPNSQVDIETMARAYELCLLDRKSAEVAGKEMGITAKRVRRYARKLEDWARSALK